MEYVLATTTRGRHKNLVTSSFRALFKCAPHADKIVCWISTFANPRQREPVESCEILVKKKQIVKNLLSLRIAKLDNSTKKTHFERSLKICFEDVPKNVVFGRLVYFWCILSSKIYTDIKEKVMFRWETQWRPKFQRRSRQMCNCCGFALRQYHLSRLERKNGLSG